MRGAVLTGRSEFLEPFENAQAEPPRRSPSCAAGCEAADRAELVVSLRTSSNGPRRHWRDELRDRRPSPPSRRGDTGAAREGADEGQAAFDAIRAAIGAVQRDIRAARIQAREQLDDATRATQASLVGVAPAAAHLDARARGVFAAPSGRSARSLGWRPTSRRGRRWTATRSRSSRRPVTRSSRSAPGRRGACALGSCASSRLCRTRASSSTGAGRRAAALQRRARAVRLRRLARPAGAAAQGRELLPAARAPLRRASSTSAPTSTSRSPSTARKRMQVLINDLLAFSRVGRMSGAGVRRRRRSRRAATRRSPTSQGPLEEAGGRVEIIGDLPAGARRRRAARGACSRT